MAAPAILEVHGLRTAFRTAAGELVAIDDVDLAIPAGQTLALVGESGSGKSVTSLSVLRLLPPGIGRITRGRVLFAPDDAPPVDLAALPPEAMRRIRGRRIGMVFQEPMTSLNPVLTVGDQIAEPLRVHAGDPPRRRPGRRRACSTRSASPTPPPRHAVPARALRRHAPARH